MKLLGGIYPEALRFRRHWKGGAHPAIISRSAIVGHVAHGAGSAPGDLDCPQEARNGLLAV